MLTESRQWLYGTLHTLLGTVRRHDLDLLLHCNLLGDKHNKCLASDQHCSQPYDNLRKEPLCAHRLKGTALLND